MRKIVVLVFLAGVLLFAGYRLVPSGLFDPGYMLISYNGYALESTFWSMLLAVGVAVLSVWLLRRGFSLLKRMIDCVYPLSSRAKKHHAHDLINKGLIHLANGDWKHAQKMLAQAGDAGVTPLLSYLVAARAASSNSDMQTCKEYLHKADKAVPAASIAIGITQAEVQLAHQQWEQALATLQGLRRQSPKHPYLLELMTRAFDALGDWQELEKLLPSLHKYKVLNSQELQSLERRVYGGLFVLAEKAGRKTKEEAERFVLANQVWKSLDRSQHHDPELLLSYAHCLYSMGLHEQAEQCIHSNIAKVYSPDLIHLYGRIACRDPKRQLDLCNKLLATHPKDPDILLALGRISLRHKLWDKAREYLEQSLDFSNSHQAYWEMGVLMAQLKEHELSSTYFQRGFQLVYHLDR